MNEPETKRRKRISRSMIMLAAEISSEYGVRVVLKPDGSVLIEGDGQNVAKESEQKSGLSSWDNWEPSPIKPELDHREARLFEVIALAGVGVPMSALGVRNCGPSTCKKLIERGYAEAAGDETTIVLTRKGREDWRKLEKYKAGNFPNRSFDL